MTELKIDNGTIDDPVQIAESLNTMFVKVASRLNVNNTQDVVKEKLRYFITSRLTADVDPFNIPQITEKDILEFITKLPTNKSTGHDCLSARVLKLIAPALTHWLLELFAKSAFFGHLGDFLSLWSGYHWKDPFLLQKSSIDDANFCQKWWRRKRKKGQGSSRAVTGSTGVNGLKSSLMKMMNISVDSSVFPSVWKTAPIAPLHKDGPRDDVNNYRPIAVLPVLSKILESHVTKPLTNYLNENNLIFKYQSAFRENQSIQQQPS